MQLQHSVEIFYSLAIASALVVCSAGASHAQNSRITPAQRAQAEKSYRQKLQNSIFGRCNATAPVKDARAKVAACQCYSKAYLDRYRLNDLVAIQNWIAKNPSAASIVAQMVTPEARACKVLR